MKAGCLCGLSTGPVVRDAIALSLWSATLSSPSYLNSRQWVDFYGEGDLFEGGGLLEGLEIVRTPLLSTPREMPARPDGVMADAVWNLLSDCLAVEPTERPTFPAVATRMSEAKEGSAGWL